MFVCKKKAISSISQFEFQIVESFVTSFGLCSYLVGVVMDRGVVSFTFCILYYLSPCLIVFNGIQNSVVFCFLPCGFSVVFSLPNHTRKLLFMVLLASPLASIRLIDKW